MPTTRGGLAPAMVINKNTGETVPCMFNPYEYTLTKQNTYEQAPTKGRNIPLTRFRQGGPQSLSLRLMFDTYDKRADVRLLTAPLWKMMQIDEGRTDPVTGKGEPPHVIFQWGVFQFEAVITRMDEKATLFLQDGTPVRSVITIGMQQVLDETQFPGQNPTSGGGVAPRTRILYASDRLDLIAWDEYGDATKWRLIAQANGIMDPLHLTPGHAIVVPPLE
jgi:hypothetical protein